MVYLMNNLVKIRVKGYPKRFIDKCVASNISLYDVYYISNDELIVLVGFNELKHISKVNYYSDITIISYEGLNGVLRHIKKYAFTYFLICLSFILIDVLNSYVVDIDVIHENKKIRDLVLEELGRHGIKKYHLGYTYDELEKIKKEILFDNQNTLEWMSITKSGQKYIIRVEERIINKEKEETGFRHIIAIKDAYITKINGIKGDVVVRMGDLVHKGDILISGEIKLYDTVKGNTLATGDIYGDVWYNVLVSVPRKETLKHYTGKTRTNFNINNKIFLNNKYQYFSQENKRELKILGLKIKIYKEKEYTYITKSYNEKELETMAFKKADELISKRGKVLTKKLLKKEANNSTIDYRIFVKANEKISKYLYYEAGEPNDTSKSN